MTVEPIEPHGFCAGVTQALKKALSLKGVWCLHELVHNELVVGDLRTRGFRFVESVEEIPEGERVLFSAHGVSPEVRRRAAARRLDVVDATCPFVARVHRAARAFAEDGRAVVVIGNRAHAESVGIAGEVRDVPGARVMVVSPAKDGEFAELRAAFPPGTRIGVVSQTTMNAAEVAAAVDRLRGDYEVETLAEVCGATRERQEAVRNFRGDAVLVLGSPNSSNTRRLAEIAAETGKRTFRAGDLSEVEALDFAGVGTLGVTSGASTPESFFAAALTRMRALLAVVTVAAGFVAQATTPADVRLTKVFERRFVLDATVPLPADSFWPGVQCSAEVTDLPASLMLVTNDGEVKERIDLAATDKRLQPPFVCTVLANGGDRMPVLVTRDGQTTLIALHAHSPGFDLRDRVWTEKLRFRTAGGATKPQVSISAGFGQADIRFVTRGRCNEPYLEDGRLFFTFSARGCGTLGVMSFSPDNPADMRLEGMICFDYGDGKIRNDIAADLFYDDIEGNWKAYAANFSTAHHGEGGNASSGRAAGGINVAWCEKSPLHGVSVMRAKSLGLPGMNEDPDGIWDPEARKWRLFLSEFCPDRIRASMWESDRWDGPFKRLTDPVPEDSTGTTIVTMEGRRYCLFGSVDRRYYVRSYPFLKPIGEMQLEPTPWGAATGWPHGRGWPAFVEVPRKDGVLRLLVSMDRVNFPGMPEPNWTYGKLMVWKQEERKSVTMDRPHVFSMSCKVPSCNKELNAPEGRERAIGWFRRNRITKLWLESYRHAERVETGLLEEERDAFRAAGFEVCGMITPTKLNDPPSGGEAPFVVCWSDPKALGRLAEESARAAKVFDTIIVDDFLFSSCDDRCARCKALKEKRMLKDWGMFRREQMKEVAGRCIIRAGQIANPKVHFIIKYPCWYQSWAANGYDPVAETRMFGECWIGTETRDANPDAVQGCCLMEAMDRLTDGKCGGGWYDALDCTPEKFVEQARYTIIGGARESLVHCYDYLLAKDPGSTPFGEKADRSHACAEAFSREVEGLARLADHLQGAERTGWEWVVASAGNNTGVSAHGFRKGGKRYTVFQNTTGETRGWTFEEGKQLRKVLSLPDDAAGRVAMDGSKNPAVFLEPHGLLMVEIPQ